MSKITLIAAAVVGLSILFVLLLIRRSAEGHEDAKGFHPGSTGDSLDPQIDLGPKDGPEAVSRSKPAPLSPPTKE
jgi:hypothetical protein